MCDELLKREIVPIGSVMIGLEHHTQENIQKEVIEMCEDGIWPMFTILSPSPGSPYNSKNRYEGKVPSLSEFNYGDSSKPVLDHPNMKRVELRNAYLKCWKIANSFKYQARRLLQIKNMRKWKANLGMSAGFWRASRTDVHPLLLGSHLHFDEYDRKPGSLPISLLTKLKHRIGELILNGKTLIHFFFLICWTCPLWRK